jgi:hypothetical protein
VKGPALAYARLHNFNRFSQRVKEVYARTKSVPKAAAELEVGERTLFRWLEAHPELKEAASGRALDKNGKPKQASKKKPYVAPKLTLLDKGDPRVLDFENSKKEEDHG